MAHLLGRFPDSRLGRDDLHSRRHDFFQLHGDAPFSPGLHTVPQDAWHTLERDLTLGLVLSLRKFHTIWGRQLAAAVTPPALGHVCSGTG